MREIVRSFRSYPALSLGSAVLWGVMELVALQRSQRLSRSEPAETA